MCFSSFVSIFSSKFLYGTRLFRNPVPLRGGQRKSKADAFQEIKQAKEMLDAGVLTQSEFDKQKEELLAASS